MLSMLCEYLSVLTMRAIAESIVVNLTKKIFPVRKSGHYLIEICGVANWQWVRHLQYFYLRQILQNPFPRSKEPVLPTPMLAQKLRASSFPRWLYESSELFEFALSVVLAQSRKGLGYPVCLAEAHNQAVIRGADRDRFFGLMTNQMVRLGFSRVGTSEKESKKRRGFV